MKKLPLTLILITVLGVILSITQIVRGDWSHPLLSLGAPITIAGAIGGVLYALAEHRKSQQESKQSDEVKD